jgi:hypothetical protein
MTGVVNQTGARSGILGTTVGTPAATTAATLGAGVLPATITGGSGLQLAGCDVDADSWNVGPSATAQYSSNSELVFGLTHKMGSNCSVSGGTVTVGTAGWYYLLLCYGHNAKSDQNTDFKMHTSPTTGAAPSSSTVNDWGGRLYSTTTNDGTTYWGKTMQWTVYFAATDKVRLYGTGWVYGESTKQYQMTVFSGHRIGT